MMDTFLFFYVVYILLFIGCKYGLPHGIYFDDSLFEWIVMFAAVAGIAVLGMGIFLNFGIIALLIFTVLAFGLMFA
jgi:hypothetical protein